MRASIRLRIASLPIKFILMTLILLSCSGQKKDEQLRSRLLSLDLNRGDIALCGSGEGKFGEVSFSLSCSEKVREKFNLATALLHSFEYSDAEKVFAEVMDEDPDCVMAYWGAAMCNFHPLWEAPSRNDLKKGANIIAMARTLLKDQSTRESDYLNAIATIYDDWEILDHRTRVLKFEKASEELFLKHPVDPEAAIFYSLALCAASDPADKTFAKQKKAGDLLNHIYETQPEHPGIVHYIIHTYDYPELAALALPAARKYASIAAASAHAQHMPSHIFTRLGLWDESIQSNKNSVSAAQCYAENTGIKGHWDEELHGMDYLLYAYLQKSDDARASEQIEYLKTIREVFPQNFKDAYSFAAMPARFAVERRQWAEAAELALRPEDFPWEKFQWEKANLHFAKLLGAVHTEKPAAAREQLEILKDIHETLDHAGENYRARLVLIQTKISEAWIKLAEGRSVEAVRLMTEAADMEDLTEKHPVTPGEIIPARELLGDMYLKLNEPGKALEAYEADLSRHPNRFNGLHGAGLAAEISGDTHKAIQYYRKLQTISLSSEGSRPELLRAKAFLNKNG